MVHRDLKPGNIFVTKDGNVKLRDRQGSGGKRTRDAPATLTLARVMTPDYASPEQMSGAAITTLTDVYSLGVVLYGIDGAPALSPAERGHA